MKFFSTLRLSLCLVFCAGPAPAAFINGHSYLSLADWAAVNGLRLARVGRSDEFVVTNGGTRLAFAKDSNAAEINGVKVALCFPVAVDKGEALIAQLDLSKTLDPLIFPPTVSTKKITTICLDPGHGGKDTGERFEARNEKAYTLALALELSDQLKRAGFKVILTRKADTTVKLADRVSLANRRNADLFVCLHFNAATAGRAEIQGPETYCITPVGVNSSNDHGDSGEFDTAADVGPTEGNRNEQKSLLLAYQIQKSLVQRLGANDRGVKRARFQVLREIEMPGILIEGGFMTHPVEGKKIFDPAYRKQMAAAMVKGILAYQKLTAPPPPKTKPAGTNKVVRVKKTK